MSATITAPAESIATQPLLIRRAAVLGAGTMGSRIAAHLANAGIPVLLLDMVPEGAASKSQLAIKALEALAKSNPAAFYAALAKERRHDKTSQETRHRPGDRGAGAARGRAGFRHPRASLIAR